MVKRVKKTLKKGIYGKVDIRNTQFTRFYKVDQVSNSTDLCCKRTWFKNKNPTFDIRPERSLCKMFLIRNTIMNAYQSNLRSQEFLGRRHMSAKSSSLDTLRWMEETY